MTSICVPRRLRQETARQSCSPTARRAADRVLLVPSVVAIAHDLCMLVIATALLLHVFIDGEVDVMEAVTFLVGHRNIGMM